mmetsp:Transcript_24549/g.92758  ORF Transcript_24549/g.92758 Transcript_24549/m.92758 type:complete len:244 (-) Transcript_24549:609-1340(-)
MENTLGDTVSAARLSLATRRTTVRVLYTCGRKRQGERRGGEVWRHRRGRGRETRRATIFNPCAPSFKARAAPGPHKVRDVKCVSFKHGEAVVPVAPEEPHGMRPRHQLDDSVKWRRRSGRRHGGHGRQWGASGRRPAAADVWFGTNSRASALPALRTNTTASRQARTREAAHVERHERRNRNGAPCHRPGHGPGRSVRPAVPAARVQGHAARRHQQGLQEQQPARLLRGHGRPPQGGDRQGWR